MPWGWRWTLLVLAVTLADLAVRLATGFDMAWVVPVEAILFLGASLVLSVLHDRQPAQVRWQLRVQQVVVAGFALAGLRAALWAGGLPVASANVGIAILGALMVIVAVVRSRRRRPA